jgi:hypothetical protein
MAKKTPAQKAAKKKARKDKIIDKLLVALVPIVINIVVNAFAAHTKKKSAEAVLPRKEVGDGK